MAIGSFSTAKCRWLLLSVLVFALSLPANSATLSGTVTNVDTGAPVAGVTISAARSGNLPPAGPSPIAAEASTKTDASGHYAIKVADGLPGVDRVLVFTQHLSLNELYDDVAFEGRTPTAADAARPGVVMVDFRQDVSGIDFSIKPDSRSEDVSETDSSQKPDSRSTKTTHMVAMSDGIHLATDVYLPKEGGPWPVVLYRTPYSRVKDNVDTWPQWNDRGYAIVTQDCRGMFDSEDIFRLFRDDGWGEHRDGYETCEWILKQPWCNGKIGTFGGSARGIVQAYMAVTEPSPPGLVCQHISVAVSNAFTQAFFNPGGVFRKRAVEGWCDGRGPEVRRYLEEEMKARPLLDDEFWSYVIPENRYHLVNWPIVHVGGWYDIFVQGAINSFVKIQAEGGPGARGKQKLIIGPYGHGRGEGGFLWPERSVKPPLKCANPQMWMDYWMRGIDNGCADEPAVAYYVLGDVDAPAGPGNTWRFADSWPVPAKETNLYFHDDGMLSSDRPSRGEKPDEYVYDPENPVPTLGGANLREDKGPYDQRELEARDDVLVYTTPVLKEPFEITGKVLIKLYASSSARDTDFMVKLCDVYPDGRSMIVCDGAVRARHRNTLRKEEFIEPGKVYEFTIDLSETCIVFNTGHRIRVSVSSSNFPRYEVNPNTGEPFNQHTRTVQATNTVYHNRRNPSHVILRVTSAGVVP